VGDSGQHANIAHPKERVRKWFDVDSTRLRSNGSPDRIDIGKIDKARRAAQCREIISNEVASQVVELIGGDKVATIGQQR
jgi:hypothetical protein